MKLLLVDLDDTLIDTSAFKSALFLQIAQQFSIPLEAVDSIYEELKKKNTMKDWKVNFQTELSKMCSETISISECIEKCLKNVRVLQHVLQYVQKFDGYKLIFSYGDPEVQNTKIHTLNLQKEVDDILITAESKLNLLDSMVSGSTVIYKNKQFDQVTIVDNEQNILDTIHSKYPWIKAIHPDNLV